MGTPPSFVLRESRMLEKYTTTIQAALQQAAQQCATDLSVTTDTF
jgi:hypothetical protein